MAEDLVEGVTQYFSSVDGVLYNADQTALLFCPIANVGRYDENGQPTYELIIPNTVQTVFTFAFHNTQGLKTLTFQEFDKEDANYGKQLLTIGNYAYASTSTSVTTGCYFYATIGGEYNSITTVNLPSHLSKVNSSAFSVKDKTNPVTVNFNPDSNNITLPNYAFRQTAAVALNIPGTLKSLGTYAFHYAENLVSCSFNLPETVKTIPNYTFYYCSALTDFEIPESVTEIGTYVFYRCESLKSIDIPANVYKIGNYAFAYSGLESFYLPATVTSLGTAIFTWSPNLKTFEFGLDENGKSPITVLPNTTFSYCTALENVINIYKLELTDIGSSVFNNCGKITEFDFTKFPNLRNLGGTAFAYSGLEVADLSKCDQLTSLSTVFQNARKLKTLILGNNMATYSSSIAMLNNEDLETVVMGANTPSTILGAFGGFAIDIVIPAENPFMVKGEYGVIYDPNYQTILFVSGKTKDLNGYTIPSTVTAFADGSFAGVKMDKLIIPEGVISIGDSAFEDTDIPYISFPASLETIDSFCFGGSTLKEIVFADEHNSKLSFLGGYAFWYCPNLEKIVLPDNLALSPNYTTPFYNCSGLKSLTIPAATKQLPATLLSLCYAMEELILQEGLEFIDTMMVPYNGSGGSYTNNVKTLYIPSTVKNIKEKAFHSFHNLETVTIGENSQLQTVGFQLFYDCHSLKTISPLPSTLNTLGYEAFANCYALEGIDLSATLLTAIEKSTFRNTGSMATVELPNGLLSIAENAFYGSGRVDLYIPMNVETIGNNAFENCPALKTLTFDSGTIFSELGDETAESAIFRNTTSLETVVLPNALRVIGGSVFENSGVKSFTLGDPTAPSSLDVIGKKAFANCANLTSFDLLENTTKIDDSAFYMCTSLESATLHEKLDYLGVAAFGYCTSLKTAYIPANVTVMNGNPYIGLDKSLINLNPSNETLVMETDANGALAIYDVSKSVLYAVFGATGEFDMTGVNMVMGGAFTGNDITKVVLPRRVTFIGDYLFMNCEKLTEVVIEGSPTRIGDYAFYNTAISKITIADTVQSIGDYAFAYCENLDNVYIPLMDSMTIGNYCFAYCTSLANVSFEDYTPSKSNFWTVLGSHMFYNCSSLTQVVLPNKFKCTVNDAAQFSTTTVTGVVPSYMFAGTGIVEAILPASVDYLFTDGVFANCKKLERIFLADQPSGTALPTGIINPTVIEGCDNFQYFYSEFITSNYAYGLVVLDNGGHTEFHVDYLLNPNKYTEFYGASSYGAYLYKISAEFKLYVHKQTWQEMIPYFAKLYDPWVMQIFDKDGNQLVCSEEDGTVAYVLDKNGNKIWEASEE